MSLTEREKKAEKALRRLTPTFMRKLSADIRHELYGRDMLTWSEKERIGEFSSCVLARLLPFALQYSINI